MSIDYIKKQMAEIENIEDGKVKRERREELANNIEKAIREGLNNFYSSSHSEIFETAEKTAIMLYLEEITPTQLRKIYDRVRRLNYNKSSIELELIKAQMAYAAGKNKKLERFYQIMRPLISNIKSEENLKLFKNFFEAVVAYNRYHAKRE